MNFETGYPSKSPSQDLPKKSLWDKAKESRLARSALVAAALHAPLKKEVGENLTRAAHAAREAMIGDWEVPNRVLDPQSTQDKLAILARVAQRKGHIDRSARDAYKQDIEKRLSAAEEVSYKRMMFDLEMLGGLSPIEVRTAEKKADALIEAYAKEVGDDLDLEEIKRISTEMFGPADAYDWAQASAVRYFNTGERNCVAIARAQGIVMEGVLSRLPPEKRSHWQLATQVIKQHQMAALVHVGDDGKRDALYILEGASTRRWSGAEDEPGTAMVPMALMQRALVSSSPIEVQAATGKPGDVKESPDILSVSDDPVEENLHVTGALKGSDFVRNEAERENIKTREMTEQEIIVKRQIDPAYQVMDVVLLTGPAPEDVRRMMERDMSGLRIMDEDGNVMYTERLAVDARSLEAPSLEAVKVLGERIRVREVDEDPHEELARIIHFGDMSTWSPASIEAALKCGVHKFSIRSTADLGLAPSVLNVLGSGSVKDIDMLAIEMDPAAVSSRPAVMPDGQLRTLLSAHVAKTINMSDMYAFKESMSTDKDIKDIVESLGAGQVLVISGRELTPARARQISKTKGTVSIDAYAYVNLLKAAPDLLASHEHLRFHPEGQELGTLAELARVVQAIDSKHPMNAELSEYLRIEGSL